MTGLEYHEHTKHRSGGAAGMPSAFKRYRDGKTVPLPQDIADSGVGALDAMDAGAPATVSALTLDDVARMLRWGAGLRSGTREDRGPEHPFRVYASAGARYPLEVYLVARAVEGLDPGVYHYGPRENELVRLRSGDHGTHLARATGGNERIATAAATVVVTGVLWRTAWRYGERGYRHVWWDAGTLSANILALARASGHRASPVMGFVDGEIDELVGIDGRLEYSAVLIGLGEHAAAPARADASGDLEAEAEPLDEPTRDHPEAEGAHAAGVLRTGEQVAAWRRSGDAGARAEQGASTAMGIEQAIRRRGSARKFARVPIAEAEALTIVGTASVVPASDWGAPLTSVLATVHAVEGMEPGAYRWDTGGPTLIRAGDFRDQATFMSLGQPLGGDAALTTYVMSDLVAVESSLGARGYRAAQFEAGLIAGRMHLAGYALRISVNALTFFDDEIRKFFATEDEPMLVVSLGKRPTA